MNEENAFDKVIREYKRRFYRYTLNLCNGHKHDAEDVLQETMISILEKRDKLEQEPEQKIGAYVCRAIYHKVCDKSRDSKRKKFIPSSDVFDKLDWSALGLVVYSDAFKDERFDTALELLDKIPFNLKEAFIGQMLGHSAKEIAEVQGTGVNTTLGRLRYAKQHLTKFRKYDA